MQFGLNLAKSSVEVDNLRRNVTAVLKRVNMAKLKEHVDEQVKKYGEQVGAKAAEADIGESVLRGLASSEKGQAALREFLKGEAGQALMKQ